MDSVQDANAARPPIPVDIRVLWGHGVAMWAYFFGFVAFGWMIGFPFVFGRLPADFANALSFSTNMGIGFVKDVAPFAVGFCLIEIRFIQLLADSLSAFSLNCVPNFLTKFANPHKAIPAFCHIKTTLHICMTTAARLPCVGMVMHVCYPGGLLKVIRVYAHSVKALMVNILSLLQITVEEVIRCPVSKNAVYGSEGECAISSSISCSIPHPTSCFWVQFKFFNESFKWWFGWASSFHGINEKGPRPDSKTGDRDATMSGRRPKFVDLDSCQSYLTRLSMPNLSPIAT
jgi:hypothetical protein